MQSEANIDANYLVLIYLLDLYMILSIVSLSTESRFLADLDEKDELVTSMLPYFIVKALAQGMVRGHPYGTYATKCR